MWNNDLYNFSARSHLRHYPSIKCLPHDKNLKDYVQFNSLLTFLHKYFRFRITSGKHITFNITLVCNQSFIKHKNFKQLTKLFLYCPCLKIYNNNVLWVQHVGIELFDIVIVSLMEVYWRTPDFMSPDVITDVPV